MGYRSDVDALIYGPADKMLTFVTAWKLTHDGKLPIQDDGALAATRTKMAYEDWVILSMHGEGWKWYESYDDVGQWMEFMRSAPEHRLNYEFVRIGEEDNDIEREEGGEDLQWWLSTSRSILVDAPEGEPEEQFL